MFKVYGNDNVSRAFLPEFFWGVFSMEACRTIRFSLKYSLRFRINVSNSTKAWLSSSYFRSSRLEVLCKKGVLKSFAKFTGKSLCQSFFFDRAEALTLCYRCFSVNVEKFLTPFLRNTSRRLLLSTIQFFAKMFNSF